MAIHASQTFSSSETAELERILGHELDPALFTRAAFVAVADLADVVKADSVEPSPWLCGPYAWLLENRAASSRTGSRDRPPWTVATGSSSAPRHRALRRSSSQLSIMVLLATQLKSAVAAFTN